jgi:hypothetical protein
LFSFKCWIYALGWEILPRVMGLNTLEVGGNLLSVGSFDYAGNEAIKK